MPQERLQRQIRDALQLGLAHFRAGRLQEAEAICRDLLSLEPSPGEAWYLLGAIAQRVDNHMEAIALIEEALRIGPPTAEQHNSLGISRIQLGKVADAAESFRQAVKLKPKLPDAHNNLGNALRELGDPEDAESSIRRALTLKPDFAEAHANLGIVLRDLGRLSDAEKSLRRALALNPAYAEAHNDLGATLFGLGRLADAETCYRQALAVDPALSIAQGNLMTLLNYAPQRASAEIFAAHRDFARSRYPAGEARRHDNVPDPRRRLRLGYVSGDFRNHPVAHFLEPVLARHNRKDFEVFCYHASAQSDAMTERLKAHADQWREASALSNAALADEIRGDGIDILVDLSGHTRYNRLGAFALRPAPVQASWLGYLNTTGLEAIGYRITDPRASPEGMFDAYHVETLVRLPDSQWCFQAPRECPNVGALPQATSGVTTFGAFANPGKMGPEVIALWARLLERVPKSRLLVITNALATVPPEYVGRLASQGIPAERLQVLGSKPYLEYLALHNSIDIMLDTFPYAGGTTSCIALWMGVPVVSLVGNTAPSRGGASVLHAVGLEELVAQTPEQYLDLAASLAGDTARLAALRSTLRDRMQRSALMDAQRFTSNLESAYRGMWRTWCGNRSVLAHRIRTVLRRIAAT